MSRQKTFFLIHVKHSCLYFATLRTGEYVRDHIPIRDFSMIVTDQLAQFRVMAGTVPIVAVINHIVEQWMPVTWLWLFTLLSGTQIVISSEVKYIWTMRINSHMTEEGRVPILN